MKSIKMGKGKDEILREEENALENSQNKANNAMLDVLSAQVKNLKEEIAKLVQELVIKEDTILSLQERLKEVETSHTELQCKNALNEKNITKLQKTLEDKTKHCEIKSQELTSAKLEVENLTQRHKSISVANSNLEKKLTEKLACNEKLKKELNQCKENEKTQQECAQRKIEDLISENKNLQKQSTDLHNVIKKQMQLINNLKRQKMHSEAAIALKITEEEFMKALDATPAIFSDT
ncbi:testis-expressed protein 9-like [Stegodyphus dumicola]|uniref:testis-expressed protein 9-like n=1 Tax=Stegodyphus dumicola TaxID=202533 RepID=UPI0015B2D000|nr:testis-expressed protein 9-like [Stegodyphus dumicola]